MLEKLEDIRWDRLEHAYGNASSLPQLLRDLASKSPGRRRESLETLFNTIWHQGTVYQATSAAVPFLAELLRTEEVKGKPEILRLLLAIHSAYPQNGARPDPLWREKPTPRDAAQLAINAKWARRARKAVLGQTDTYLLLLKDASPEVRALAVFVLGDCGQRAPDVPRRLKRAIDVETHLGVKVALIDAWCRVSRKSDAVAKKLRSLVRNSREEPVIRFISAARLQPSLREQPRAKWVSFLARTYRDSGKPQAFLSRWGAFDLLEQISNRGDLRLELCLELAEKTARSLKDPLCAHLELLCHKRWSYLERVIPVFGGFLSDHSPEFRTRAAMRLAHMGTWSRLAREPLVRALRDSHLEVALWSAVALSKVHDGRVLPFVIEGLAPDQHTDVPEGPIPPLSNPSELLKRMLGAGKHLQKLRLLLDALRPFGPQGRDALPLLRELLLGRGAEIQKLVCGALAAIGEPAREMVPNVGTLLKNPQTQCEAAAALMRWGTTAARAIPDLIDFLKKFPGADTWAQSSAMAALGAMGNAARGALPALNQQLGDSDHQTKCAAALAIWRIAPQSPGIIEALVRELRETTKPGWATHGCAQVIETLGALGPSAEPARPILEKLLDDPIGWVRVYSARALWKIGTNLDLILPVLIDNLLCRPLGITAGVHAAECLADIGPPAATAIPRLEEILASEASLACYGSHWVEHEESYRNAVARALAAIGGATN